MNGVLVGVRKGGRGNFENSRSIITTSLSKHLYKMSGTSGSTLSIKPHDRQRERV